MARRSQRKFKKEQNKQHFLSSQEDLQQFSSSRRKMILKVIPNLNDSVISSENTTFQHSLETSQEIPNNMQLCFLISVHHVSQAFHTESQRRTARQEWSTNTALDAVRRMNWCARPAPKKNYILLQILNTCEEVTKIPVVCMAQPLHSEQHTAPWLYKARSTDLQTQPLTTHPATASQCLGSQHSITEGQLIPVCSCSSS